MSYTIKNLKEIEDSAVTYGLSPQIEARFGRNPLGCEQLGISYERLAADTRLPWGHRHAQQEEAFVVLGGSGRVKIEDEVLDLHTWDLVRIGPGTMRGIEAGPDGLELLVVGAPVFAESDAEVVEGWWS